MAKERAIDDIYGRPGVKLRRAHQISQSIFTEECRALDLTPTQCGVLFMLALRPEQQLFLALLEKLLEANTAEVRVPFLPRAKLAAVG